MEYKKIEKRAEEKGVYVSRTKVGFCKNKDCNNLRRFCSSFCADCSEKHNSK